MNWVNKLACGFYLNNLTKYVLLQNLFLNLLKTIDIDFGFFEKFDSRLEEFKQPMKLRVWLIESILTYFGEKEPQQSFYTTLNCIVDKYICQLFVQVFHSFDQLFQILISLSWATSLNRVPSFFVIFTLLFDSIVIDNDWIWGFLCDTDNFLHEKNSWEFVYDLVNWQYTILVKR